MNSAYLCLGGNIGNRENALHLALIKINEIVGQITSKSKVYETEAWGVENQKAYLNQCVKIETKLTPNELISALLAIEKSLGRERTFNHTYEPRTLDIDILLYNDIIVNTDDLIIPHPRLQLRRFVLIPLNEIASNYLHPLLNKTIFNLLIECEDNSEVKQIKI
ncbi:MAG: 2-amino-4-hydroxy-6-hydroxymethyldihydropteridine diphosphokinase [Burkholderiales bacterium]|nr:2-amino-4-hydroxy-6-hydroxymethyldihydropteridine diphosphokinase [Bacteroidia bacterium]